MQGVVLFQVKPERHSMLSIGSHCSLHGRIPRDKHAKLNVGHAGLQLHRLLSRLLTYLYEQG